MNVKYCKKCHERKRGKNFAATIKEIEALTQKKVQSTECVSYCGPGKKTYFVTVDEQIIEANSYAELLQLIKEKYDH